MARGEPLLDRLSTDGESKCLGVLLPESIPVPELDKKSPGVGVAQLSAENMSGGATIMSSSSTPSPRESLRLRVWGTKQSVKYNWILNSPF